MTATILAIDLGKFNSVLCWYEPATREATFRTVKTTPAELRRELLRQPVGRVVMEACSPAGWVHDLCEELHLACDVANTAGAAWQWKNVKRKTDRDDALKLARLCAVGELPPLLVAAKYRSMSPRSRVQVSRGRKTINSVCSGSYVPYRRSVGSHTSAYSGSPRTRLTAGTA